jgi:GT2 family glycosyltransferase
LSRAFNLAWRDLPGGDVFLVNPDVTASADGLMKLQEALLALPSAALVGPRLVYSDGSTQLSARSFPSVWNALARRTPFGRAPWGKKILNKHLVSPYPEESSWASVDWLLGAAMLIRREALEALGGFDERYFLYCEDADFCARAWLNGYQVVYCTDVTFQHEYQRASRHTLDLTSRATRAHWRSTLRLASSYPKQYFGAAELRPQTVTVA